MKKWRANKHTKPMVWFNLKTGCWYGDAEVMREAISRGMTKTGIRFAQTFLSELFDVATKELRAKKRRKNENSKTI